MGLPAPTVPPRGRLRSAAFAARLAASRTPTARSETRKATSASVPRGRAGSAGIAGSASLKYTALSTSPSLVTGSWVGLPT
jgi:hypothetical protein